MKICKHKMAILLTPRTPGLKIFLLVAVVLLSYSNTILAQSIRLQPLTSYQETLKRYHNKKWLADRKEFQVVNKKKWWYYLPNLGWAFGMPTVTLGTSTLAQIDRDKNINAAKLEGLDARAKLEYNEQMEQLLSMYKVLSMQIDVLGEQDVVKNMESRLLQIAEEANNAKEIKPDIYLTELLKYQKSRQADDVERRRLIIAIVELERFAHYYLTDNELVYYEDNTTDEETKK